MCVYCIAMKELTVKRNDAGQRLDRFIGKAVPLLPEALLQKYIRIKRIKLNGKGAKRDTRLTAGDVLSLYINDEFFEKPREENSYLKVGTPKLNIVYEKAYSDGVRATVKCYGADDVQEGVAIMHKENVGVSITGNSTNPTRFQHPVAGTYKKECIEQGKKYFSVASGGGTGRTLHPDNMAAGPASYGMTDTLGRMHSDAQFAGSSSVPAHVEMMGLIGAGNNPMVGMTVSVAVAVEEAAREGRF